jgi:hypothetical protein
MVCRYGCFNRMPPAPRRRSRLLTRRLDSPKQIRSRPLKAHRNTNSGVIVCKGTALIAVPMAVSKFVDVLMAVKGFGWFPWLVFFPCRNWKFADVLLAIGQGNGALTIRHAVFPFADELHAIGQGKGAVAIKPAVSKFADVLASMRCTGAKAPVPNVSSRCARRERRLRPCFAYPREAKHQRNDFKKNPQHSAFGHKKFPNANAVSGTGQTGPDEQRF